jgi:hypothetical protein
MLEAQIVYETFNQTDTVVTSDLAGHQNDLGVESNVYVEPNLWDDCGYNEDGYTYAETSQWVGDTQNFYFGENNINSPYDNREGNNPTTLLDDEVEAALQAALQAVLTTENPFTSTVEMALGTESFANVTQTMGYLLAAHAATCIAHGEGGGNFTVNTTTTASGAMAGAFIGSIDLDDEWWIKTSHGHCVVGNCGRDTSSTRSTCKKH